MLNQIIKQYTNFDEVEAIALGGSFSAGTKDRNSDIDIYVYVTKNIPINVRGKLIKEISTKYEIGGEYFGSGDEYYVDALKVQFDVMYWNKTWFESGFKNVWLEHYPSNGYTTCFLYTLKNHNILYDKNGWLSNLKSKLETPFPKELKDNITKRNFMLLKDKPFASYYEQIEKAIKRNDTVSVNHRIAAFLASYFDILFAVNEQLHPGEKRLIQYVKDNCSIVPQDFEKDIERLLKQPNDKTLEILDNMIVNLKKVCLRR